MGEYSLLTPEGVLESTIWTPANASGRIGSTVYFLPANSTGFPADFSDARNLMVLTGKARSTSTRRIKSPTAPVAPTTAKFTATEEPPQKKKGGPGDRPRFMIAGRTSGRGFHHGFELIEGGFGHEVRLLLPIVSVEQLDREEALVADFGQSLEDLLERGDAIARVNAIGVHDRVPGLRGGVIVDVENAHGL